VVASWPVSPSPCSSMFDATCRGEMRHVAEAGRGKEVKSFTWCSVPLFLYFKVVAFLYCSCFRVMLLWFCCCGCCSVDVYIWMW
jgi:hypothetical protein